MQNPERPKSTSSPEASRMGEVDASLLMAVAGVLLGTTLTVTAFLGSTPDLIQAASAAAPATIWAQSAVTHSESSPAASFASTADSAPLDAAPEASDAFKLEVLPVEPSACATGPCARASAQERSATTS